MIWITCKCAVEPLERLVRESLSFTEDSLVGHQVFGRINFIYLKLQNYKIDRRNGVCFSSRIICLRPLCLQSSRQQCGRPYLRRYLLCVKLIPASISHCGCQNNNPTRRLQRTIIPLLIEQIHFIQSLHITLLLNAMRV